eukprot:jgi/Botrbrau1/14887/Bobra.0248s0006.1
MAAPRVDSAYRRVVEKARAEIAQIVKKEQATPLFIRLAFHDAMTHETGKTTGANGSIRTKQEIARPENQGLSKAMDLLAPVKAKHKDLTYADLIQLAGIVAIEEADGPKITFTPGRKDTWAPAPEGLLFNPSNGPKAADELRAYAARLGNFPVRRIIALLGISPLGRWLAEGGDAYVPDAKFDNSYFRDLVAGKSKVDKWLMEDPELRMHVETFAKSPAIFFTDYGAAHEELSRLGTRLEASGGHEGFNIIDYATPENAYIAGAVVVGVVVVGAIWWNRRRRLLRR